MWTNPCTAYNVGIPFMGMERLGVDMMHKSVLSQLFDIKIAEHDAAADDDVLAYQRRNSKYSLYV